MSSASPIAAGVVMPRSSSSRPIAIRRRIVVSRSACRARRSSAESLEDGDVGWSGGMPGQLVMAMAVVTLAATVLSSPPDGADGDGQDEDEDEAAKDEAD